MTKWAVVVLLSLSLSVSVLLVLLVQLLAAMLTPTCNTCLLLVHIVLLL